MTAQELLRELQSSGVRLAPNGERLRIEAPRGVLTQHTRQRLARLKPELLQLLKATILDADAREYLEERAAIAEYDGGLPREEAESSQVRTRVVAEYRRVDQVDWSVVLGAPGQGFAELSRSLDERFGDIAEVREYQSRRH